MMLKDLFKPTRSLCYLLILNALLMVNCKDSSKKDELQAAEVETTTNKTEKEAVAKLQIFPISHATAVLNWDNTTIYVDPVGGAEAFSEYPEPDLILITDIHGDHFDLETLMGLQTQQAKIVMPQAVADQMPDSFTTQIDILSNGEQKERYGISVTAVPMYNLREEAKDFHVKGRGNGYVLEKNGERIYFSGDTEDIPEMRALENIDKAFVCMNLPYTMTVDSAANAVLEFKPAQVYPYHYRGRPEVSDVSKFRELVTQADPDIEVVQLDWYPSEDY
ncbi:MBL fold metallo-hydrolase [Robiginitalea sp. IMCC43444]|uniref:MBL fold metallo-hydrolase n=1 Tax=Robiginitalea sp. IMCC43444 TaxID=3459121 RepID=UPI0040425D06